MPAWSADTVMVQVPSLVGSAMEVAVMITVPTLSFVITSPVEDTIAMSGSLLFHVTPVLGPDCVSTVAVRV